MLTRQKTRLDLVRDRLDEMLNAITDEETRRCGFVHLYGVGQACALIALRRGHDLAFAELAEIAGMLHDYATYRHDIRDHHAELSSEEVEPLLRNIGVFSEEEISKLCHAIAVHSDKEAVHGEFDEILKDADIMQHALRNPMEDYFWDNARMEHLTTEFRLSK